MKGEMELQHILPIILLFILLAIAGAVAIRFGSELLNPTQEGINIKTSCSLWAASGCKDNIPSDLLEVCESLESCKFYCGGIGTVMDACKK